MSIRQTCEGSSPYSICSPIIIGTLTGSFAYSGSYLTNSTTLRDSSSLKPFPRVDGDALSWGIASYLSPIHWTGTWTCNSWTTGSSSLSISRNKYTQSGSYTASYCSGAARKKGHKLVQSSKEWHGREGFICPTDASGCYAINNRYCTITRHTRYREGYYASPPTSSLTITFDATSERVWTVDKYSGAVTIGSCYNSTSIGTWNETKAAIIYNSYNGLGMAAGCYDSASQAAMNYDYGMPEYGFIYYQSCSFSDTEVVCHFETNENNDYLEHSTTITLSNPFSSSVLYSDAATLISQISLRDLPWSEYWYRGFGPKVSRDESPGPVNPDQGTIECTMYDATPYTGSGSQPADWESTHQQTWWQTGYTTGSKNCNYTGEIIGQYYSGSGKVSSSFDWGHITYRWTTIDSGVTYNWFPTYYGAWSKQNIVAYETLDGIAEGKWTQWTNNFDACYIPKGAHIMMPPGAGKIMLQKYEEIKEPIQSYNFARPCATDRFMPDMKKGSCISDVGYVYPDIGTTDDLTPYLSAGDSVYICSGSHRRISQLDDVFTDHVVEGLVLYEDQSLWEIAPREFVGKLKYFPDKSRNTGICGIKPYYVNSAINTSGQPVTCSSADNKNHYLIDGDKVYLYSNPTSNVSGGYYNVMRVNSQSFALQGTVWLSSSIGGMFSVCHSSSLGINPDTLEYYNDKQSKGDIVFVNAHPPSASSDGSDSYYIPYGEDGVDFLGRYSTGSVSYTSSCVPYRACGAIFGCSPSADYDTGCVTSSFRSMFAASSCGAAWSSVGIQMTVDPLYQSSSVAGAIGDCGTPLSGDCGPYVEPILSTSSISMPPMPPSTSFSLPTTGQIGLGKAYGTSMPNYEVPSPWSLDSCPIQPI